MKIELEASMRTRRGVERLPIRTENCCALCALRVYHWRRRLKQGREPVDGSYNEYQHIIVHTLRVEALPETARRRPDFVMDAPRQQSKEEGAGREDKYNGIRVNTTRVSCHYHTRFVSSPHANDHW